MQLVKFFKSNDKDKPPCHIQYKDFLSKDHLYLNPYELVKQCSPDANPIYDNFRNDLICEVMRHLQSHGVTLCNLMELSKCVPTILPWNAEYDRFRQNVNRRWVVYPWILVMAKRVKHVVRALNWANKYKIPICMRGGSHCSEPFSLINGMIIDQSFRKGVKFCGTKVKVEPGNVLGPLAVKLQDKGLVLPIGTCPNNGVTGYTLGGGIGLLLRKFGLGCDSLIEVDILLADERLLTVNDKQYPDLFWALRGAGNGNFGIVTSLTYQAYECDTVTVYELEYPLDMLPTVGPVWQSWAPFTIEDTSPELNISNTVIRVDGIVLGKHSIDDLLSPLLALNPTKVDIKTVPYVKAVEIFAGKGYWPPFFKNKSDFVTTPLPDKAFQIITEAMTKATPNDRLLFGAFGGKVSSIPSDSTAFAHRNSLFWILYQSAWSYQQEAGRHLEWISKLYQDMRPYVPGGCYFNITDLDIGPNYLDKYFGVHVSKLIDVKNKYDPSGRFKYEQGIPV